ncbi:hypothetical protein A3H08_00165 [Candidatus Giovannonibacteria bacterium RIFCSPLOWO2_12_FULL_44_32]|nr:MAG: hypothetical protein A3H08_00165 [Candidatus Giovannonibacteria bacterium RIFCSPLOWO2_12_FULL_44_32]
MPDNVCLIIAPSVFLLDERVFMSLGILKVASVLENAGKTVEMLDLSGIENFEEVAEIHASASPAKHFGITATTPQMPAAARIAGAIRKSRPDAKIILGGPHITLVNAAFKKEKTKKIKGRAAKALNILKKTFDILVAGDGEEAIFLALKENAPKLIDADEPKSSLFLDNARLNLLPYPARHLVDAESYRYFIGNERAMSLIAQLGCPFECGFCGGRASPFLRRVRMRSLENIVCEMKLMHERYSVNGFMLYDDELNVNKGMIGLMREIQSAQTDLGVLWRLRGFVKAELFTEEQAEAMYNAGFRWILTGFESGSPRILENINKKATREDNTRAVEIAHKAGLKVKALMSIGHPGESAETVKESMDWLLEVKPDDFDVTIITTYPGSPYYDDAVKDKKKRNIWVYTYEKTGDKLYSVEIDYTKVADYYKGSPDGGYHSFVYTEHLSADELVKLRDLVEKTVRTKLGIPFNPSSASMRFEHSMGQSGSLLPEHILKISKPIRD